MQAIAQVKEDARQMVEAAAKLEFRRKAFIWLSFKPSCHYSQLMT